MSIAQRTLAILFALMGSMLSAPSVHAAFPLDDLRMFYIGYLDPSLNSPQYMDTLHVPVVSVVGGAPDPGPRINWVTGARFYTAHRLMGVALPYPNYGRVPTGFDLGMLPAWWEQCASTSLPFKSNAKPDEVFSSQAFPTPPSRVEYWCSAPYTDVAGAYYMGLDENPIRSQENGLRATTELVTLAPVRRTAIDGGQYDASPMQVRRNGAAWYTHFWGYRLGLVANESNFVDADRGKLPAGWPIFPSSRNNFELATLPPPWVEDDVVEYVNRTDFPNQPGGQYFYAVRAEDKTLLDSVPAWQRSGKGFKSGGYVSACRFYGGKNGGPNTHFYSADHKECAALKAIPQLGYEGQTFAVNVPLPGSNADGTKPCPIDSKPLYRVYNNASMSNGRFVSNHRYLTEKADVTAVVAQGWVDEGQVMCVPL